MRFACDSCGAQYMIADEKVGARGVKVKCKKCGNMIVVKPSADAAAATRSSAMADTGASAGVASGGLSSMSASGTGGSFGGDVQGSAPQGDLGGAFSSMFGSTPAGDEAPAAPESSTNGSSYSNGNHEGASDNGSAFGFQSSFGGGGGDTDMALGQLEQPQAPVSSDRGGERVWYVAIEDAQVGPVNLSEVEERWDNKEIDEDTLVWKAGMPDWIPLVDVVELAYLITERPQAQRSMARSGATAAAGSALGMQASGGYAPQEMADEPSWRPSAASALSSLVQEELVAKKPDAPEPDSAPKGMEGLNIGANDIFGSGNGGTPITVGQSAPATATPAVDPYASSGSPAWSVPSARRSSGSGIGTKVVVGLLFVAVLGLGGFMWRMMQQQPKETVVIREVQAPAPTPPSTPVDPTAPPVAPPLPTPAPTPVQTTKPKTGHHDDGEKTVDKGEGKNPEKGKGKTPKPSGDPLDEIDNANKNAAAASAVKEALSKDDIIEGVKANGSKLGPCVTAARSKEEIQPGRVQFVLDWNINPNGSVTAARLKGPQEVMNTSLPSCFARVMGSWKFAASKTGAPITNFPLPITVR